MKKFLMSLVVVAAMASVATAGVGIQWMTGWGGYTHDAPNITDDPSAYAVLDHYSVIWQLVYSGANGTIQAPDLNNAANGYVSGDDAVWATRTIATAGGTAAEDSTSWNNFLFYAGGGSTVHENAAWSTAGTVYQRVFEGTPAAGTYWYDSPLFTYDPTWTDSQAAELFNPEVNPGAGGFQAPLVNQFPVPEPATMSLLGLGALVMAVRRRRS